MIKLASVQKYQNALACLRFGGIGRTTEQFDEALSLFQDLIDQIPEIEKLNKMVKEDK